MTDLLDALEKTVRQQRNRYFGKYRGFVADVEDPETRGRCRLTIPSVLGETVTDWALPVVPYGGGAGYGMLMVPPVGSQIVAEFLEGDLNSPVWTGTFWRKTDEVPQQHAEAGQPVKFLVTEAGHSITLQDTEGEEALIIESAKSARLEMDPEGSLALTDNAGATVTLDAQNGEINIADANGNSLVMSASGITCKDPNGNEISTSGGGVDVKSSAVINIEGSMVTVAGAGGEPLIKGSSFLAMFNSHIHNATSIGAPTSPPIVPLTPSVLTTKTTAS